MNTPLLFSEYQELAGDIPWLSLGTFPTRVHPLKGLSEFLEVENLWIKRDDESGKLYGGNKVRKLEYLLADARFKGCHTLIVMGAIGSNYVLATTIYGKSLGFEVVAVLFPQPIAQRVRRNFRITSEFADELCVVPNKPAIPAMLMIQYLKHIRHGKHPHLMPPGGSSPLGCLGYVNAAFELKRQIDAGVLPAPDYIFVALGSCGTMAGLELGIRLADLKTKIIGVRVVDRIVANKRAVARLANRTLNIFRKHGCNVPNIKINSSEITIFHGCFGGGYGVDTQEATEAIAMMQKYENIQLEGTYTGKALAGCIRYIRERKIKGRNVLFWNTYTSYELRVMNVRHQTPVCKKVKIA